MKNQKAKYLGALVCLVALFYPKTSEARFFRRGGFFRRGPVAVSTPIVVGGGHTNYSPPSYTPPTDHGEPDNIDLPTFDDAELADAGVTFSQARPTYLALRNRLLQFGDSASVGLGGRCFNGSSWSTNDSINLNMSHGRLRIGHSDSQITFREQGWIQFVRRGTWGWEHQFLRSIGGGRFQFFRRSNGGHTLRCTLNSISEIRGTLPTSILGDSFAADGVAGTGVDGNNIGILDGVPSASPAPGSAALRVP